MLSVASTTQKRMGLTSRLTFRDQQREERERQAGGAHAVVEKPHEAPGREVRLQHVVRAWARTPLRATGDR